MENLISILSVIAGLLIRLAIPLLLTGILIFALRKLDTRWQAEAQLVVPTVNRVQKPECWKIKNCPPEQIKNCVAASSPLPCWQVYRLPNGYLREECISCKVFTEAPMPALKIQPRRM
jgi:hypothetical protein